MRDWEYVVTVVAIVVMMLCGIYVALALSAVPVPTFSVIVP